MMVLVNQVLILHDFNKFAFRVSLFIFTFRSTLKLHRLDLNRTRRTDFFLQRIHKLANT